GDEKVIKAVFQNRRKERLSMQRYSAETAIEAVDQKMCETANQLNELRHQRVQRELKVQELQAELDRMADILAKEECDSEEMRHTRLLENSLDKALMKCQTARNISSQYEAIVEKLKEEQLLFPAKLEVLESELMEVTDELKELTVMNKQAQAAGEEAKMELSRMEQEIFDGRRKRDQELVATRKEVERRKESVDKMEKKGARHTLYGESHQDQKAQAEQQRQRQNQTKILTYEEAFDRIKEATLVSDISDVVIRVEMQDEKRQQLEQKRQQLEGKRNQLLREKERMLQIYHDLRYTGEKALSDGERKLEEKQDQLRKLWDQHWRTEKKVLHGKKLYQTLSVATDNLLKKLHGITLKPPHNLPRTGNLKHDLELCKAKLSALLESVDVKQIEDAEENISAPEYHEFLESRLPSTNVRIHLAESLGSLTDFHYDSHTDDTDVLTRDDIKRQGQELADAKLKPKKKKPRKK
ncbi:coiled-coil domain-containing protein 151-like, partial [Lingula anatina]|uniref:Coiled-coil domain-containing protein 151-like n=1 Tax=Lingula anatina TaxID=7574 RepID=A0A1S3IZ74_LINAN